MTDLCVLDEKKHHQLRLDKKKATSVMAKQPLVPVVTSEFLKLAIHFPIVITKQVDTGRFGCSALMGLDREENLFLSDLQWLGLYWPAHIRRQPFQVGRQGQELLVCFHTDHPAIGLEQGEALFSQGKDTACLRDAKSALAELVNGEHASQAFLQRLEALALLIPLQLEITGSDNKPHKLAGLYSVDDRKLSQLTAEQLMTLQRAGDLSLIYTLLASHGHIYALVNMKNKKPAAEAA